MHQAQVSAVLFYIDKTKPGRSAMAAVRRGSSLAASGVYPAFMNAIACAGAKIGMP